MSGLVAYGEVGSDCRDSEDPKDPSMSGLVAYGEVGRDCRDSEDPKGPSMSGLVAYEPCTATFQNGGSVAPSEQFKLLEYMIKNIFRKSLTTTPICVKV